MYMGDNSKIKQYRHENGTWIRTLDYMQQENVYLKNRLAEIVRDKLEQTLLEQVEYFQNNFLNKDAVIALLRHDIATESQGISTQWTNDNIDLDWLAKHERLRVDMSKMEKEFSRLKFEFNKYLSEIL